MAIDRWLLEQHVLGLHPPVLRFYTWEPIAISLGYHQRQIPDAWAKLTWQGNRVELVRRPSGGRAVLHQGDLTYAVITSAMPIRRIEAYERLCKFLIAGWRSLGVTLNYGTVRRGYIHNPSCFGSATGADLVMPDGTKLIGSAQFRRGDAILQHGSMRLCPDPDLFKRVFDVPLEPLQLPWELGFSLDHTQLLPAITSIVDALTIAACECFGIHLVIQPLSEQERTAITETLEQDSTVQL